MSVETSTATSIESATVESSPPAEGCTTMRIIAALLMFLIAQDAAGAYAPVSVRPDGTNPSQIANDPALSADGRYVLFDSYANDLAAGANSNRTVYLRDMVLGVTEVVSLPPLGATSPAYAYAVGLSSDGRYAAFVASPLPGQVGVVPGLFVRDRATGTLHHLFDGPLAVGAKLSSDGLHVAFLGYGATGLPVPPTTPSGTFAAYLVDVTTGNITLVSRAVGGGPLPVAIGGISADGRFVLMMSGDPTLDADFPPTPSMARLYLFDRNDASLRWVSRLPDGVVETTVGHGALSDDGDRVLFSDGTDGRLYLFVRSTGFRKLAHQIAPPGNGAALWWWTLSRSGRYASVRWDPGSLTDEPAGIHRLDLDSSDRVFLVPYYLTAPEHVLGEDGDSVAFQYDGIVLGTDLIADVEVTGSGPSSFGRHDLVTYTFTIKDLRGAPVSGAVLDVAVTASASLVSIVHDMPTVGAHPGGCAFSGTNTGHCTLTDLAPGDTYHVTIGVQGAANGAGYSTATLQKAWSDDTPGNDHAKVDFTVGSTSGGGDGGSSGGGGGAPGPEWLVLAAVGLALRCFGRQRAK